MIYLQALAVTAATIGAAVAVMHAGFRVSDWRERRSWDRFVRDHYKPTV